MRGGGQGCWVTGEAVLSDLILGAHGAHTACKSRSRPLPLLQELAVLADRLHGQDLNGDGEPLHVEGAAEWRSCDLVNRCKGSYKSGPRRVHWLHACTTAHVHT